MWNSEDTKQVKSDFFKGVSLFSKATESIYGAFMKEIKKNNIDLCKLEVPKIIVIGCESSGKSSLLENIVKCQLFPKSATFGTKQPIHLILKPVTNKSEISYRLTYRGKLISTDRKKICNEIGKIMDDTTDEIIEDEILIEIFEVDMINFEFYDLPGIRAYPPNLETKTKQLVMKYLSQTNIIPICVVPVTTPRITSYVPLALIKSCSKEKNTLICLTMCDRLQSENVEDLLIGRISGKTDEYNIGDFAGVTAVINRSHRNSVSLSKNDDIEKKWFTENIYKNIPGNFIEKKKIFDNTTIANLITNLDIIYKDFMKKNWIPTTIGKIKADIDNNITQLNEIGFDPNDANKKENYKNFVKNEFLEELFAIFLGFNVNTKIQNNVDKTDNYLTSMLIHIDKESILELVLREEKIFEHHKSDSKSKQKILAHHETDSKSKKKIFEHCRFVKFHDELCKYINDVYTCRQAIFYKTYCDHIAYDKLSLSYEDYSKKLQTLCTNIKREICINIYESLSKEFESFDTFINLDEGEDPKNLRIMLTSKIKDLNLSLENVTCLQNIN